MNFREVILILFLFYNVATTANINEWSDLPRTPMGKGKLEVSRLLSRLAFSEKNKTTEVKDAQRKSLFQNACLKVIDDRESASRSADNFFEALQQTEVFQATMQYLESKNNIASGDVPKLLRNMWMNSKDNFNFRGAFCGYSDAENNPPMANSRIFLYGRDLNKNLPQQHAKSVQMDSVQKLLQNTSPEFELAVFTVCALSQPEHPLRQSNVLTAKRCRFIVDQSGSEIDAVLWTTMNENREIKVKDVAWELPAEKRPRPLDDSDDFVDLTRDDGRGKKRRKKHNNTDSNNDPELRRLVSKMWSLDSVDRVDNSSIILNYGHKVDGKRRGPNERLFTWVNESFMEKPIYAALLKIYDQSLFHRPVCQEEPQMLEKRREALENFMNAVTNTSTFKIAYDFLRIRNKTGPNYDAFYKRLFDLWFGTYSRCDGTLGSSGWEHVFSGEYKDTIVEGQHYWVRYYLLEKAGEITYNGYYAYEEQFIATIQYKWKDQFKKMGGFLIRSSPAFDFSLFTVCTLTHVGSEKCKFQIEDKDLFVTSFTEDCNAGRCLATSYPGIKL